MILKAEFNTRLALDLPPKPVIFGLKFCCLSLFLYNLSVFAYSYAIKLASLWNKKAAQWVAGRKQFPDFQFNKPCIWVHCASLGEFEQGRPVIEALRKNYPQHPIVLSFFSPSGFEIRKNYAGADRVIYLPIDNKKNAERLIKAMNPAIVFWVKYEYWFHFLLTLQQKKIPVILVSGIFRESQPFFKWYGGIWKNVLGGFDKLFVQNETSLHLLKSIGFEEKAIIAGDTRFDRVVTIARDAEPLSLIEKFVGTSPVLVAGSTWEDDEIELIHYVKKHPEIKFIIAPHEIDHANLVDVKKEFQDSIFYSTLESVQEIPGNIHVLIIDNMGMLSRIYRYADVAYIGGGFNSDGIHNTLEAAVYGIPVVFGPEYEKFAEAKGLIETGGAFSIDNALQLEKLLDDLFTNNELLKRSGEASENYVQSKQGATEKIMRYVAEKRLLTN
jgi:3-deoxy-D-manno-octulosonic-acid transferase